ncbi:MAG TPA: archaeal proteasome endopeptidase complex subunit alpha [Nitrososphaeria archaeon]|nr:MAG: proteasome subunit alpha [Candidatus Wolframiiraptor sp.]HDD39861.1 archaeal proteasome endopeptidase complex subunit alpha [Nitrososphaeria archaeon]
MALGIAGAYDRAITVFSPQGRLYQVEYALETVRSGSTAMAIASNEGCVLAVEERLHTKLQNMEYSWKLFQVDEHIGAVAAGLNSDARVLVDNARIRAQVLRLTYDERPTIEAVTKYVGDLMQMYTQHAGVRPFGVAILFGGVDDTGVRVFYTEPSGMVLEYDAWAIGRGAEKVKELLEAEYKREMSLEDAVNLALKALVESTDKIDENWTVRLATVPVSTQKFQTMSPEELKKRLEPLLKMRKGGS